MNRQEQIQTVRQQIRNAVEDEFPADSEYVNSLKSFLKKLEKAYRAEKSLTKFNKKIIVCEPEEFNVTEWLEKQ